MHTPTTSITHSEGAMADLTDLEAGSALTTHATFNSHIKREGDATTKDPQLEARRIAKLTAIKHFYHFSTPLGFLIGLIGMIGVFQFDTELESAWVRHLSMLQFVVFSWLMSGLARLFVYFGMPKWMTCGRQVERWLPTNWEESIGIEGPDSWPVWWKDMKDWRHGKVAQVPRGVWVMMGIGVGLIASILWAILMGAVINTTNEEAWMSTGRYAAFALLVLGLRSVAHRYD
jgi:hypothetical protein